MPVSATLTAITILDAIEIIPASPEASAAIETAEVAK
jgi:hypothetical protein